MAKLSLSDVSNITGQEASAINTLNNNFSLIETALENTLSRDGTFPNSMGEDLDMNMKDILNVNNIDVVTITVDGVPLTNEVYSVGPAGPTGPQGPAGTTSPAASTTVAGILEVAELAEVLTGSPSNLAVVSDVMKSILDIICPVGTVQSFLKNTAPTGWLELNGLTIGNASSGATGRANADVSNLFSLIWSNTDSVDLPIYSSTGVLSTKGVSASADFSANKRISLPDFRGEFLRGWDNGRSVDTSRTLGSSQTDLVKAHTHTAVTDSAGTHTHNVTAELATYYGANNGGPKVAWAAGDSYAGAAGGIFGGALASGAHSHTVTVTANTGAENRPRNVSVMYCVRY